MHAFSRIFVLILLFTVPTLRAQWQNVAPNLLGNFSSRSWAEGAMTFNDGKLWIGRTSSLWVSADSGTTWTQSKTGIIGRIRDICAFDRFICMFCTDAGEVYITKDGGISWQLLPSFGGPVRALSFFDSPQHIIFFEGSYAHLTHDGGATWTSKLNTSETLDCKWLGGGVLYFTTGNTTTKDGVISISTDYGETWRPTPGIFDHDSYTFEVAACNPKTIVVVNEDYLVPSNTLSSIFRSTDNGTTWQSIEARDRTGDFFCGSISGTRLALFAQTHLSGIMRSTDEGATWTSIGGPNGDFDTRLVTAINSNIIFAVDQSDGSVYRTMTSGGDPLADNGLEPIPLSVSASVLFDKDSVDRCDSTLIRSIVIRHRECTLPQVGSDGVVGNAAQDYSILSQLPATLSGNDTILIRFNPSSSGLRDAKYEITLTDGRILRIGLRGMGIGLDTVLASPGALDFDSLYSCNPPTLRTIFLSYIGCVGRKKATEQIVGDSDFSIASIAPDSLGTNDFVRIRFQPNGSGKKTGFYVLTLANGETITIPLTGYGKETQGAFITTMDREIDTLGVPIQVPIIINDLDKPTIVELVVHYDTRLTYLGSFASDGSSVDIPGQQFPGRAKIRIPTNQVRILGTSGYAAFDLIADTLFTPQVWFDSLNLTGPTSPCALSTAATSSISLPPGCDYLMIANFFYHQTPPSLSVVPNPNSGSFSLISDRSLGEASLQVFDAVGMLVYKQSISVSDEKPLQIDLSDLASGYYRLTLTTVFGAWSKAIIIQK